MTKQTRTNKGIQSGRWLPLAIGGISTALMLYLIAKRILTDIVKTLHSPKPNLCQGFESEDVHCVNLGITTVYLLKGKHGYLMIDTGYPQDYDKFRHELARRDVALDEITALLLTHGHDDHAGFAAQFVEETGVPLIMHRDAIPLLKGEQLTHRGIRFLNGRVFILALSYMLVTQRNFGYPPVTLSDADLILDGDNDQVLHNLGFDAHVITTPGHTKDSISVVTSRGDIFCGDAMMSFLPVTGARLRPIFVTDKDAVFASWRKMLDSGARVIYPAHGAPITDERLAAALREFRPQLS